MIAVFSVPLTQLRPRRGDETAEVISKPLLSLRPNAAEPVLRGFSSCPFRPIAPGKPTALHVKSSIWYLPPPELAEHRNAQQAAAARCSELRQAW